MYVKHDYFLIHQLKIVSEYDQKIQQSQTADKPWHREEEPNNDHETPGRQTNQGNQHSLPIQDDCKMQNGRKVTYNKT